MEREEPTKDLLEGLNPGQRQAVTHGDGPLLVVAGAGTGKTQVITRRMAYLIQQGKAKPTELLALTFTEKAAREMAERLYDLIGWESFSVPVLTFNAFGAELLGRFGTHIGRSTRGGLINDTQKLLLIKQRLDEVKLRYYTTAPDMIELLQRVVSYIGKLQNAGVNATTYNDFVQKLKPSEQYHPADILEQQDLAALYNLYEQAKTDTGTYDYYDQLAIPLAILRERPNLAQRLATAYRYVLVDEYQDTSPVQDALLREFISPNGNLFAVGDDDQAVYGFRGADINNILGFTEHFKVAKPLALVENYRSGQPILDAAYRLIRHNDPERLEAKLGLDKRLKAQTKDASVSFVSFGTAVDEQTAVVEAVAAKLAQGQPAAGLAVLARSNAVLRGYAKALGARQIPFAISTEMNIFEQREIINLWYLLEWIGGRARDEAISHVILGPFVGWSAAQLRSVVARANDDLSDIETALREVAPKDKDAAELIERLDRWRGWAAEQPVSQLGYRLVFETGVAESWIAQSQASQRLVRVFEDLQRLLTHMQDYETIELDPTLAGYLANFPAPPGLQVHETLGESEGVQLLTVHAAKGLEFDCVWVVGCVARAWSPPTSSGLEVPAELLSASDLPPEHEERRLMYVAVTRAKRELQISAPTQSPGGQRLALTPLINEVLGEAPVLEPSSQKSSGIDVSLQKLQRFYPLQAQLPPRLPFETTDGWLELGVGDLERYDLSPHDFYLQQVLAISRPFGPQLAFGAAVHATIQAYFEAKLQGQELSAAELSLILDERWSDRGYDSRSLAEAARERAHTAIRDWLGRQKHATGAVTASELPIKLEIPEAKLRLRGRIDALFSLTDGVEVRDFKTGSLRDADKIAAKAKNSFQLRTYALALKELSGQAPAQVTLDYVVTGVEGSAQLTPRILANHREKLAALAERIRQRDFDPGPASAFKPSEAFKYYGEAEDDVEAVDA